MTWLAFSILVAIVLLGVAISAVVRLRRHLVVVTVEGSSMWPAFFRGDRVLVRRTPVRAIRRDQVVVVESPGPPTPPITYRLTGRRWVIKRAAAVPGDPVPVELVPVLGSAAGSFVPDGKLLVLSDNPSNSIDSRTYGYIPGERVLGVVLRTMGPPKPPPPEARHWMDIDHSGKTSQIEPP